MGFQVMPENKSQLGELFCLGKANKIPGVANGTPVKDIRVKFEIQVYKMKDERYMIDFQRMDGGVMTCMDAAAAMMKNLRLT